MHRFRFAALCVPAIAWLALAGGCVVGQRPGAGQVLHLREPTTNGWYYLYLPDGYAGDADAAARHPLVMTFHGMKPFDSAGAQIREWQQEADRYGFVVCAPELLTPDLWSPLPLQTVTGTLTTDEKRIEAIMDEVGRRTNVDPSAVLSTSWSYGGYVAHYMANRHPHRFSCIAVKQSNFSPDILDASRVNEYREHKVGIFFTENDFRICREESLRAAHWYTQYGFDVKFQVFEDLGHERTPSLAAAFFAQTCGATAKSPPVELARLNAKEVVLPRVAGASSAPIAQQYSPSRSPASKAGNVASRMAAPGLDSSTVAASQYPKPLLPAAGTRPTPVVRSVPQRATMDMQPVAPQPASRGVANDNNQMAFRSNSTPGAVPVATPPSQSAVRSAPAVTNVSIANQEEISVRLSSTIGISPLLVSYSVTLAGLPQHERQGAYFLWTDNEEPISNGQNGQKFLLSPGEHRLEVLVTTESGKQYRAGQNVTVLDRVTRR